MRLSFVLLAVIALLPLPIRASDVDPDVLVTLACKMLNGGDFDSEVRSIAAFNGATVSERMKTYQRRNGEETSKRRTWKTRDGVEVEWTTDTKTSGHIFAHDLTLRADEPEKALIFRSKNDMLQWLGRYGSVKHDADVDEYRVAVVTFRYRQHDIPSAEMQSEFSESRQDLTINWLTSDADKVRARLCR